MRVDCDVDYVEVENDNGIPVESVEVTCSRCGHTTMSFGQSGRSIRRCLALMSEECPEAENNFYVTDGSGDDEYY